MGLAPPVPLLPRGEGDRPGLPGAPRLPNPDADRDAPYFWQGLGIFPHSVLVTRRLGLGGPAFTEFIIPDASHGRPLAAIELHLLVERWCLLRDQYRVYGNGSAVPWDGEFFVQGIPLVETVEGLLDPKAGVARAR